MSEELKRVAEQVALSLKALAHDLRRPDSWPLTPEELDARVASRLEELAYQLSAALEK